MRKALPWGLAAVSVVLLVLAGWKAVHPLAVLATWKSVQANILEKKFYHSHDSNGFLTYGSELRLRYEADGRVHEITVISSNLTTSFPEPFRWNEQLRTDLPIQVRYSPSNPERVEFDTTLSPALPYLLGALGCGFLIVPARRWQNPKGRCPQCNTPLESFWRYCAECSEPIPRTSLWRPAPRPPPVARSKD